MSTKASIYHNDDEGVHIYMDAQQPFAICIDVSGDNIIATVGLSDAAVAAIVTECNRMAELWKEREAQATEATRDDTQ